MSPTPFLFSSFFFFFFFLFSFFFLFFFGSYKASESQLAPLARKSDGLLPVTVGVVFFCPKTAEKFLLLQVTLKMNV
jgi:hypothetical protein